MFIFFLLKKMMCMCHRFDRGWHYHILNKWTNKASQAIMTLSEKKCATGGGTKQVQIYIRMWSTSHTRSIVLSTSKRWPEALSLDVSFTMLWYPLTRMTSNKLYCTVSTVVNECVKLNIIYKKNCMSHRFDRGWHYHKHQTEQQCPSDLFQSSHFVACRWCTFWN